MLQKKLTKKCKLSGTNIKSFIKLKDNQKSTQFNTLINWDTI